VKKADIFVGILIIFVSVSMFIMTQRFVGKVYTGYGPDRFPRFLAIVWSVLGIILIVNAMRDRFFKEDNKITAYGLVRVSVVIGMTVAVLVCMNFIGFVPATMIYIFAIMTNLQEKSWFGRVVTSIAVTMAVFILFKYVMVIPLPEFTLFQFPAG